MDSSSSAGASASTSSTSAEESRPQAGPLPQKRGEIGYDQTVRESEDASGSSTEAIPERHPEDRRSPVSTPEAAVPAPPPAATPSLGSTASTTTVNTSSSSTNSITKKKHLLGFLRPKCKNVPSYGGLRLTTLIAFTLQSLAVVGTIIGWYFAIAKLSRLGGSDTPTDNSNGQNNGQGNGQSDGQQQMLGGASSAIFVHVVFGVATLVQLLFIERRVFRLRAERYSFLHPGEILPSARRRELGEPSMGFSPWNRPPLPTYAAALAQSGAGTGDVEDHLIAAPPPPAYGNTRGSTFLLSGFLRDSLRAQRPVSASSERSMSERSARPLSYKSIDEDWEIIQNADRAARLEETLATLERPAPAATRRP